MSTVRAKLTPGVPGTVEVTIEQGGLTFIGVVTRQWLAERFAVGPNDEDLLSAFEAHRDYICDAVLKRARAQHNQIVVLA